MVGTARRRFCPPRLATAARLCPPYDCSRCRLGRDDLERVHLTVLVADRDIFARHEAVTGEPIARLVVLLGGLVVIEHPARVLLAAGFVHQLAELLLVAPEPADAAMLAVLAPQLGTDAPVGIERRHELIAVPRRARGRSLP